MKLMKANQEKAEISFIFGNRILIDAKLSSRLSILRSRLEFVREGGVRFLLLFFQKRR